MRRTTFSSGEVCRIANVTYRQLDYWTRRGYIRELNPLPGSGTNRRYSAEEMWRVRLMGQLTDAGLGVETAVNLTFSGEYDANGVFRSKLAGHVYVEIFP